MFDNEHRVTDCLPLRHTPHGMQTRCFQSGRCRHAMTRKCGVRAVNVSVPPSGRWTLLTEAHNFPLVALWLMLRCREGIRAGVWATQSDQTRGGERLRAMQTKRETSF